MEAAGILVSVLVFFGSTMYVASDSAHYDWTAWHHPTHDDWHPAADSPGAWFVICLLLWPIFFLGYFWDRKYAPRKPPAGRHDGI
jgi:hypothetical protein